ncbi:binary toxin-like calcium binding domain-containing protein [Corynebacterium cystitidis]|uniref:binary toxin-like calcium binding domain-containing protein n=1 Tax=Corynebacterium cystitidis TaxID=35757 RepID=UPI00211DEF9F|nr:binary toxin-like calcium binding domain-containing protein [Corynebacterium cystitidis]
MEQQQESAQEAPPQEPQDKNSATASSFTAVNRLPLVVAVSAAVLVVALVIGAVVAVANRSEPVFEVVETPTPAPTTSTTVAPVPTSEALPEQWVDTDGDGIPDELEIAGWTTASGEVFRTDPLLADTDGDGLSDGEEAGNIVEGEEYDTIYEGVTNPVKADSDDDGLDDKTELEGWEAADGRTYSTDPMNADTDGDGISDGLEAGTPEEQEDGSLIYQWISNPTKVDSDGDGLDDLRELDAGTDPFAKDTDGDGLRDSREVLHHNTNPLDADTDGDGFDDLYEIQNAEAEDLDPLFYDEKRSREDDARDFARGFLLGEWSEGDSVSWLMGNLMSVGVGVVPVAGWVLSAILDLRDLLANVHHRRWGDAAASATGVAPYVGDAPAAVAKVTKFLKRFPGQTDKVLTAVARSPLPEKVKVAIQKTALGKKWEELKAEGFSDKAILKMQASRGSAISVHFAMSRRGHVRGHSAPPGTWKDAENNLEQALRSRSRTVQTQVSFPTGSCKRVCNPTMRYFDVVADGVAHESKAGYHPYTDALARQIRTDAYAVKEGTIGSAHWHFFPDKNGRLGGDPKLLDLLDKNNIPYTYHTPKA